MDQDASQLVRPVGSALEGRGRREGPEERQEAGRGVDGPQRVPNRAGEKKQILQQLQEQSVQKQPLPLNGQQSPRSTPRTFQRMADQQRIYQKSKWFGENAWS